MITWVDVSISINIGSFSKIKLTPPGVRSSSSTTLLAQFGDILTQAASRAGNASTILIRIYDDQVCPIKSLPSLVLPLILPWHAAG